MRVTYRARLKAPLLMQDYWPAPFLQGEFRPVEEGKKIVAFEIAFSGQSADLAPALKEIERGEARAHITVRDHLQPFVRMQLESALSFIQCYFDVEIAIDEIKASYAGETAEEEKQIAIKSWSTRKSSQPATLSYDYFTRAIMAAQKGPSPEFEATLVGAARKAMLEGKFIDSFRYSFLLIEALHGDGKFRTNQLKQVLQASNDLKQIVEEVLKNPMKPKRASNSASEQLLAGSPSTDQILDHLVEMRGFYFHGNVKRKDGWRPQKQQEAEALCLLALEIAMGISHRAAAAMFEEELSVQHFDNAKKVGAVMTFQVKFEYRDPAEPISRQQTINMTAPATKVTGKLALYLAKTFLEEFENRAPMAALNEVSCIAKESGQKVFDIKFHVGDPAPIATNDPK